MSLEVSSAELAEALRRQGIAVSDFAIPDGSSSGSHPRLIDGAAFVLDTPTETPALWGQHEEIVWAGGEPLFLVGPIGVGKTTLMGCLALAHVGIRPARLLGFPVRTTEERLLYVAADRPQQIRRSFARMVAEEDRDALRERIAFWEGPLEFDLAREPERLVPLARSAGAGSVFIDSLKDVARDLVKDETGTGITRAYGHAMTAGIELVINHHQRKTSGENAKPKRLDDVYGSTFIAAGAGSVVLLWGEPGDPVVQLSHLKPPADPIGPFDLVIDHDLGAVEVIEGTDLLAVLRSAPAGMTADDAARALFSVSSPSKAQRERARRRLERYCSRELAHRREETGHRGAIKAADRYFATPPSGAQEPLE